MSLPTTATVSFIGLGNMNSAVLEGLLAGGHDPESVRATVGRVLSAETKSTRYGITVTATEDHPDANREVSDAGLVVLGVKPKGVLAACEEIAPALSPDTVVVSVAAGISIASMAARLPTDQPIVRAMPNTPLAVQQGAVGLAISASVTDTQREAVRGLFEQAGTVVVVPESQIDLVAALSGSGPAYFFHVAELMAQAAAEQGMDADVAEQLAAATLAGAGRMIATQNASAAELRENITSPQGTTEAALRSFTEDDLAAVVARGMSANISRSEELSREFGG
ncbi:MAG: pyrroline-5-carboxylate reductase [Micrococcaceae bacterium]